MTNNYRVAVRIDQIYSRYKAELKGYISKYISSSVVAEDMVQDLFYKFIVADREDTIELVSSWLYRVAKNQIIDHSRKRKEESMPYLKSTEGDEIFEVALADLLSDDSQTPEIELLRSMVWEELECALAELPEEQRIVFVLNELQGVPFADISQASDTPINTLISRKRYAVKHIRERLAALYNDICV